MDMSSSSDESPDPMKSSSRSSSKAKSKSSSSSSGTIISPKGRITKSTLSAHTLNILKPGYLESRRELLVEPPEEAADDCFLSLFGREAMTKGTKKRRKVESGSGVGDLEDLLNGGFQGNTDSDESEGYTSTSSSSTAPSPEDGGIPKRKKKKRKKSKTPPTPSKKTRCFNCGKVGHMARDCPNPPATPSCNLCGLRHRERCRLQVTCFQCYTPGHTVSECGGRAKLGPFCTLCGDIGHFRDACVEVGSRGEAERRVCLKVGRGRRVEKAWACMTCGREGHWCCFGDGMEGAGYVRVGMEWGAHGGEGTAKDKLGGTLGSCWNWMVR
ncbi:hypothetical protein TrRE_jg6636 [Triparma retinervis]|uniref:CCHC-type domain-containing protein n=1 Tax=Triparma retinervis TaxID=2557542 RepID=A0A9W7DKF2_9STRA|nr:hypothetical protein TrRE_jg6636 [Triparma retinervis]